MAKRAPKAPDLTIAATGEATNPRDDVKLISGQTGGAGGSPPEDPMLEKRVEFLEAQGRRIEETLARLENKMNDASRHSDVQKIQLDLAELKGRLSTLASATDLSELKGKVSALPSSVNLWFAAISTWVTGAGIVTLLLKFGPK